jgi:hypothetical protein
MKVEYLRVAVQVFFALAYGALALFCFYKFVRVLSADCLLWLSAATVFAKQGWAMFDRATSGQ